jgi:hypothetical protein
MARVGAAPISLERHGVGSSAHRELIENGLNNPAEIGAEP